MFYKMNEKRVLHRLRFLFNFHRKKNPSFSFYDVHKRQQNEDNRNLIQTVRQLFYIVFSSSSNKWIVQIRTRNMFSHNWNKTKHINTHGTKNSKSRFYYCISHKILFILVIIQFFQINYESRHFFDKWNRSLI